MQTFKELLYLKMSNYTITYSKVNIFDTIKENKYDLINSLFNKLSDKNIDLKAIKTIHFTPGCEVPRYKLKNFNTTHGLSTIRDITKADAIISSKKSLNNIINNNYYYTCNKLVLINFFEMHQVNFTLKQYDYQNKFTNIKFDNKDEFITELKNNISDIILIDHNIISAIDKYVEINKLSFKLKCNHKGIISIEKSNVPIINILCDSSSNVYPETEILKHLNIGPIIDVTMYNQLKEMIKSPDKTNILVAMEIMANSNYDESIVYLSLLFREFYENNIMGVKEKNHINFKSLVSYLSFINIRRIELDTILAVCMDKDLLTRNNVNILLDLAYNEYKHNMDSDYFKITKVELPPDILARVIENELIEQEPQLNQVL